MPELPEVETVRRVLEPLLVGRRFDQVAISDPRLTAPLDPDAFAANLTGERVAALERRGKYLLVVFESGRRLVIHLRMTGSLRWRPALSEPADDAHQRALIRLDDGSSLAYRDVRRFGTWQLLGPAQLEEHLARRLGAEPLAPAFTARALGARLAGRRVPLKAAILDQRTLAGVGNIYADEALWRARLHPRRGAGSLDGEELGALHRGIRAALREGIARQGSTLRDYSLPDGASGTMQHEFKVYGRAGEPCPRCGTPIERIVVGGRGSWYCPHCQRLVPASAEHD
jgi:formamidopyrimidine-DNA glycosylase